LQRLSHLPFQFYRIASRPRTEAYYLNREIDSASEIIQIQNSVGNATGSILDNICSQLELKHKFKVLDANISKKIGHSLVQKCVPFPGGL